jgi:UDP-glucose 4-epimerase
VEVSGGELPLRWLVTGGCGFVGRNLCAFLTRTRPGDRIRILDDFSSATLDGLRAAVPGAEIGAAGGSEWRDVVTVLEGDVRDRAAVEGAMEGADIVVHLAANTGVQPSIDTPLEDCARNVTGTVVPLDVARGRGLRCFIFASSGAPAGETTPPIREDIVPRPISPYGASKLAGEAYCSAFAHAFDVPAVALRFSNVYGPHSGHKGSVVARFIRDALAGRPLTVYGDGLQTRDFIHVHDLVAAIAAFATTGEEVRGEVFQVATGVETSVTELLDHVRAALASCGVEDVEVRHEPARAGDMRRNYSDITKIRTRIGWAPRITLATGIPETVRSEVERAAVGG